MGLNSSDIVHEAETITHSRRSVGETLVTLWEIWSSTPIISPDPVGPDRGRVTSAEFLNRARSNLSWYAKTITENGGLTRAFAFSKLLLACDSLLTLSTVRKSLSGDPETDKVTLSKTTAPYEQIGKTYEPTWLAQALNQQAALDTMLELINKDVLNENERGEIQQTVRSVSDEGETYYIIVRSPQPFATSKPNFTPYINLCNLHSIFRGLSSRAQEINEALTPGQKT